MRVRPSLSALLPLVCAAALQAQVQNVEQCVAGVDYEIALERLKAERASANPDYTAALGKAAECIRLYGDSPRPFAKRAEIHTHRQAWDLVISDATRAIELDPKSVTAYLDRGYALLKLEKLDEALADYNKALEIDPEDLEALTGRGDVHRLRGDRPRAFADYGRVFRIAGDQGMEFLTGDAYFGRGSLFLGDQKWHQAVNDFTSAIKALGGHIHAYESRAFAYEMMGNLDLALADYDTIIEARPNDVEALERRAAIHLKKGNRDRAASDYQALLALDPNHAEAKKQLSTLAPSSPADYIAVAREHAHANRWDDAVRAYGEAIRVDAQNADAYAGRAAAHSNRNATDLAIADYTKAIEINPKHLGAHNGRAAMYASKNDDARALADYSRTIALASATDIVEATMAHTSRGDLYMRQGKPDLALADYDKAIVAAARDGIFNFVLGPDAYLGRGRVHLTAGKNDLARADFEAALKLNPKHETVRAEIAKFDRPPPPQPAAEPAPQTAEAWFKVALRKARRNDADGALAALTKCIELDAKAMPCYVFRGNARAMMGQYDLASADYEAAMKIDPNHGAPYAGRGIMLAKQGKRDEAIRDLRTALRLTPTITEAKQALQQLGAE